MAYSAAHQAKHLTNSPKHQQGFLLITVVVILAVLAALSLMLSTSTSLDNALVAKTSEGADLDYVVESGMAHAKFQLSQNTSCINYADLSSTNFGDNSYSAAISAPSGTPVSITVTGVAASGATRELTHNEIKVYGVDAPHETIQPGATAGKDAYLWYPGTTDNYGSVKETWVSTKSNDKTVALYQFDLSAIPAGAKIKSATLSLHSWQSFDSNVPIDAHQITKAWNETEVSWDNRTSTEAWDTPAGDFAPEVIDTTLVGPTTNIRYDWQLKSVVEKWVNGSQSNYGVLLRTTAPNIAGERFYTSDEPNADKHPKLTIIYACECGVVCDLPEPPTCDADFIPGQKVSAFEPSSFGSGIFRGISFLPEGGKFNGYFAPVGGAWLIADAKEQLFVVGHDGAVKASCGLPDQADGAAYILSGSRAGKVAVAFGDSGYIQYFDQKCEAKESFSTSGLNRASPSGITHIAKTASGTYDDFLAITDRNGGAVYLVTQNGTAPTTLKVDAFVSNLGGVAHLPGTDKLLLADSVNGKVHVIDIENFSTTSSLAEYSVDGYGVTQLQGIAINGSTCDHVVGSEVSNLVLSLNKANDLIAHWKLDEASGLVAVDSAGGHNGVMTSGSWTSSGIIDGALKMPGNAYVRVPHDDALILNNQFTLSAWVIASPAVDYHTIINKGTSGRNQDYWFGVWGDWLTLGFYTNGGFNYVEVQMPDWIPSQATHFVASFDNATDEVRLYKNGVLLHTGSMAYEPVAGNEDLIIGRSQLSEFWDGMLDDIRIYNRALGEKEVNNLFTSTSPVVIGGGGGIDPTPLPPPVTSGCNGTYADAFNSVAFDGSTGTIDWADSPWEEVGESDGANAGDIRVEADGRNQPLRLRDNDNRGEGVKREMDLTGATSATLTFDYRRSRLDRSSDYAVVQMSAKGMAGPWTEIARYDGGTTGTDAAFLSDKLDISSYISSNTAIQLITSPTMGGTDTVHFDNIQVSCSP